MIVLGVLLVGIGIALGAAAFIYWFAWMSDKAAKEHNEK